MLILQRTLVVLWFPFFIALTVPALFLSPLIWIFTGENGIIWWVEHMDPFEWALHLKYRERLEAKFK